MIEIKGSWDLNVIVIIKKICLYLGVGLTLCVCFGVSHC